MTLTSLILTLIVMANSFFVIKFIKDLLSNKSELKNNNKQNLLLAISSFIIFFFSSFGISDFALSTILYRKKKLASDKFLPGTLNTQFQ